MTTINYGKQQIEEEEIQAVVEVLKSDFLTQGPKVKEFEDAICEVVGSKYCVAVSNGTAALHIAVACLEIEKGKEGITSPNSFLASANCMVYNNIKPSFADINPITYCIDSKSILNAINEDTRLLIPVHFAGQPCEMHEIAIVGKENDLFIIEDAAHAIGAKYKDMPVGNCYYSNIVVFSFHPVKIITTGEGGASMTNDGKLAEHMRLLRSHGITRDVGKMKNKLEGAWYYEQKILGFNYRMTDIQAALGISQMNRLDRYTSRRVEIMHWYNKRFEDTSIKPLFIKSDRLSACHLYVIRLEGENMDRNSLYEELRSAGIGVNLHYIPLYRQPFFKKKIKLPNAEKYYRSALSLPIYPTISNNDLEKVTHKIFECI